MVDVTLHPRDGSFSFFSDEEYELQQVVDLRYCNKCQKMLPKEDFSNHSGGNYLRPECRKCNNRMAKVRNELKAKYGMPPEGYTCPICEMGEEEVKNQGGTRNGAWVVDHNHDTDEFRGWLCHKCNRTLGGLDDSEKKCARAVCYLMGIPQTHANFIIYTLHRMQDDDIPTLAGS